MHRTRNHTLLLAFCLGWPVLLAATSPAPLQIRQQAGRTEIFLPAEPVAPVVGTRYRLRVERSADLKTWDAPVELPASEDPTAPLKLTLVAVAVGFYRLQSEVQDTGGAADGAELFGYNRVFKEELRKLGYPSVEEFTARFAPTNAYLTHIGFDPTTARYWSEFNTDPVVFNAGLPAKSPDRRLHDFRLNAEEFSKFQTNGFVVSERLGSYSFADVYYKVFADDFPVFISADSALHAWHWSYQAMLSELEETQLTQALKTMLDTMSGGSSLHSVAGNELAMASGGHCWLPSVGLGSERRSCPAGRQDPLERTGANVPKALSAGRQALPTATAQPGKPLRGAAGGHPSAPGPLSG